MGYLEDLRANAMTLTPEPATPVVEPVVEDVVDAPAEEKVVPEKVVPVIVNKVVAPEPIVEEPDNGDPFKGFLEVLGIETKIESFDDLKAAAEAYRTKISEQYASFEDEELKQLAEFKAAGGSIEEFKALPQPTSEFQDKVFEDDHISGAEAFLSDIWKRQGMAPKMIANNIKLLKEDGELITEANTLGEQLKEWENGNNEQIIANNQATIEERRQEQLAYFTGIAAAYDKGLNGVTADKNLVADAKRMSLRNTKGEVEIMDVINSFTPEQYAYLNLAALAIAKKANFEYKPVKTAAKPLNPAQVLSGGGNKIAGKPVVAASQDFGSFMTKHFSK